MSKYDKFLKEEHFYKHPLEDCVVRTIPTAQGWDTFLKFSKGKEYKPVQNSNIIMDALLSTKKEWITKKEYYDF